jgi:hypothetical protein
MLTTVATKLEIAQAIKQSPITAKQMGWLTRAEKEFQITVDFSKLNTVGQASALIGRIQSAINVGSVKPRIIPVEYKVTDSIHYAVVMIDGNVSIKSFIGTGKSANEKAIAKYGTDVLLFTHDVDVAKTFAKDITTPHVESLNLSGFSVVELKQLASEQNISLKGLRSKSSIINAIISAVA